MRPIVWGFILAVVGCFFWIIISVIYGIGLGLGAKENPTMQGLVYLFGSLFLFSVPVALVIEIVNWIRLKGSKKTIVRMEATPTLPLITQPVYFCTNCGRPLKYNPQMQKWHCQSCGVRAPTKEELLQSAMKALDLGDTELAKKFIEQAQSATESA
ncbi:MAG: hypothetical protein QXV46_07545 [Candidatus Bathyarchaeia archaeon]